MKHSIIEKPIAFVFEGFGKVASEEIRTPMPYGATLSTSSAASSYPLGEWERGPKKPSVILVTPGLQTSSFVWMTELPSS